MLYTVKNGLKTDMKVTSPLQPEQRLQPEISNEDESRSWKVSPSDRLVFRAKADAAGGEMETTLTVANRCHIVAHHEGLQQLSSLDYTF